MAKENKKIEELEALRDEYLSGWKRAQADLANYKKDEAERMSSVRNFACESLISELLTVLDSFGFALASSQDEDTKKGVEMIKAQLLEVLKRSGLEKIETKEGDDFDESLHESLEGEGEKISEIVADGYRLNGKVIRAVKVKL